MPATTPNETAAPAVRVDWVHNADIERVLAGPEFGWD